MEEFVDTLRVLAGRVGRVGPAGAAGAAGAAGSPRMPALPHPPLKVFLVTHAGGPGVYTMDLLAAHPRHLAPAVVTPETKAALAAAVPPMSSVCRPEGHIDMTASATPAQHAEVVKLLLADPGVDALVTLDLPIRFLGEEAVAEALAGAWREAAGSAGRDPRPGPGSGATPGAAADGAPPGKVFLPLLMHGKWSAAGCGLLERAGLCALAGPDRAVTVLVNLARLVELEARAWRHDLAASPEPESVIPGQPTSRAITLNEAESAALLGEVGVPFAVWRLARTKADILEAARAIGYPVVLKLCSRRIPHKVAVGAVRLGLKTPGDLQAVYEGLAARAAELLPPASAERGGPFSRGPGSGAGDLDGFLVQAQAERGQEVIVGGLRDPLFGPVIAVGQGGTRVGSDAPLLFRLAPLSPEGASRLAEELLDAVSAAGGPTGGEGFSGLDTEGLARAVLGMSRFLVSRPDVAEADLNPVIVYPRGRGAVAVDALVRLGPATGAGE